MGPGPRAIIPAAILELGGNPVYNLLYSKLVGKGEEEDRDVGKKKIEKGNGPNRDGGAA